MFFVVKMVASLKMASRLAETCACRRAVVFIMLDTSKCLYEFVGFISISNGSHVTDR